MEVSYKVYKKGKEIGKYSTLDTAQHYATEKCIIVEERLIPQTINNAQQIQLNIIRDRLDYVKNYITDAIPLLQHNDFIREFLFKMLNVFKFLENSIYNFETLEPFDEEE